MTLNLPDRFASELDYLKTTLALVTELMEERREAVPPVNEEAIKELRALKQRKKGRPSHPEAETLALRLYSFGFNVDQIAEELQTRLNVTRSRRTVSRWIQKHKNGQK